MCHIRNCNKQYNNCDTFNYATHYIKCTHFFKALPLYKYPLSSILFFWNVFTKIIRKNIPIEIKRYFKDESCAKNNPAIPPESTVISVVKICLSKKQFWTLNSSTFSYIHKKYSTTFACNIWILLIFYSKRYSQK